MTLTVSLRDVVNEMEVPNDEWHAYLNKHTGELVTITDEDVLIIEMGYDPENCPEWQREEIARNRKVLNSEDYLELPSRFDIHEYSIMERFCYSVQDPDLSDELLYQIRGSGAFRRFKDAIHRHDIADDWYRFRWEALEEIAIKWLEANGIAYTRETKSGPEGA